MMRLVGPNYFSMEFSFYLCRSTLGSRLVIANLASWKNDLYAVYPLGRVKYLNFQENDLSLVLITR